MSERLRGGARGDWFEAKREMDCGRCRETIYPQERYFRPEKPGLSPLCESCGTRLKANTEAWRDDPTTRLQGQKIRKLAPDITVPKTKGEAHDLIERLLAEEKA